MRTRNSAHKDLPPLALSPPPPLTPSPPTHTRARPSPRPPCNLALFTRLHTLILDKNGLPGLAGFPPLPSLTQLWFNNNAAEELPEFCDDVCALFPALTWLSFMRNPASPPLVCQSEEDAAAAARYRLYVVYRMPRLQWLDSQPVTPAERAEAAKKGKFLAARKPKPGTPGSGPPSRAASSSGGGLFGMLGSSGAGWGGGGGGSSGAGAAPQQAPQVEPKKPSAYLAIGRQEYNGRHSEGNRFISDKDL